jgi:hypothetical protein
MNSRPPASALLAGLDIDPRITRWTENFSHVNLLADFQFRQFKKMCLLSISPERKPSIFRAVTKNNFYPVEPSVQGGQKLADEIVELIDDWGSGTNRGSLIVPEILGF